jgi:hypothetical protein
MSTYTFPDGYTVQIITYEKAIELHEDGEAIYFIDDEGHEALCTSTYDIEHANKHGLKFFTE